MNILRRFLPVTGLVGLLAIGLPGTAIAGGGGGCPAGGSSGTSSGSTQVFANQFSGLIASASFRSVSGTTETDIFLSAEKTSFVSNGSGSMSVSEAFVSLSVFDTVTRVLSVDAFGATSSANFQMDRTLTSAKLASTPITVCDILSFTSSTATVAANWTGVGSLTRGVSTSTFHSGNFTMTEHFVGSQRGAQASGSLSDTALNLSFSGTAGVAELESLTDGSVSVCVGTSCK